MTADNFKRAAVEFPSFAGATAPGSEWIIGMPTFLLEITWPGSLLASPIAEVPSIWQKEALAALRISYSGKSWAGQLLSRFTPCPEAVPKKFRKVAESI